MRPIATLGRLLPSIAALAMGCGDRSESAPAVTVFAAASLADALEEVAAAFRSREGIEVRPSLAASSLLAQQIDAGAPADIFFPASEEWMEYAVRRGRIDVGTVVPLLTNRIVLIAPAGSAIAIEARRGSSLADRFDGRLAIADPDAVPAGIYAREALSWLGWWEGVRDRLAPAVDARAALAYVERGECSLGVVYESDAHASARVRIVATLPEEAHRMIIYPAGVVAGRARPEVLRLIASLRSREALAIFERHGFREFRR